MPAVPLPVPTAEAAARPIARPDAIAVTAPWCRELGASYRQRTDAAHRVARALRTRGDERQGDVERRWPGIVAAIRALVAIYNEGAGVDALVVTDRTERKPTALTLDVAARGGQILTVALDGDALCARANDGTAGLPDGGTRWLTPSLSDEDTAASALQHWLTQL